LEEGVEVSLAVYRQLKNSLFKVENTEMLVSTPEVYGRVDRLDGTEKFVRVIDYKTGAIDDDPTSYYVGKKLQLQLYMSSLKGERVPAGVFYFPASVNFGEEEGRFRMHGFVNGNAEALRAGDINIEEGKFSEYFPAGIDKTSKWVLEETAFRNFLDYSIFVARQGAKELKEGYIAPTPYEGACTYCKYGGMCGFNPDSCSQRAENTVSAKQIAEIARVTREGKEENNE
jgi:ATP-dependent helicase/nuclease subunit B